jgi:hypothetical protein
MPSDSLLLGKIVEIRMSRIAVRMPVSVARGTCGKPLALSISSRFGEGRLRNNLRFQEPGEYPGEGLSTVFTTKKERKAEDETMMTAILHSCCIQNANQTMSTLPPLRLIPAILTMATMTITRERQRKRARPSFWRILIRTFHRRVMGKDTIKMSVTTSITVVMEVSRIVL